MPISNLIYSPLGAILYQSSLVGRVKSRTVKWSQVMFKRSLSITLQSSQSARTLTMAAGIVVPWVRRHLVSHVCNGQKTSTITVVTQTRRQEDPGVILTMMTAGIIVMYHFANVRLVKTGVVCVLLLPLYEISSEPNGSPQRVCILFLKM